MDQKQAKAEAKRLANAHADKHGGIFLMDHEYAGSPKNSPIAWSCNPADSSQNTSFTPTQTADGWTVVEERSSFMTAAATVAPLFMREFPDFDRPDYVPPAGFTDTSWHNDASPSFSGASPDDARVNPVQLFINYANPALREYECAAFVLGRDDATLYEGDDLEEAARIAVAAEAVPL